MLLALDLDRTTLDDAGELTPAVHETLRLARRAGHTLCFVTGRRDVDMLPLLKHFKTVEYILLNNGGKFRSPCSINLK